MDTKSIKEEVVSELAKDLSNLHIHLAMYKPNDRSELDRQFAIAITDLEKLKAYIVMYIINSLEKEE